MANSQTDDGQAVLTAVLPDAVRRTSAEVAEIDRHKNLTRSVVRSSWIRCLRDAFSAYYPPRLDSPHIAVFGGTPRSGEERRRGVPTGIPGWSRWEFLHDVAVVEWVYMGAAYAKATNNSHEKRSIPIVTRALWQVESELAENGTAVAEDVSKLTIVAAENKLLIASYTGQRDEQPWLDFLARVMSGVSGIRFVALVPNYRTDRGYAEWRAPAVRLRLYRFEDGRNEMIPVI